MRKRYGDYLHLNFAPTGTRIHLSKSSTCGFQNQLWVITKYFLLEYGEEYAIILSDTFTSKWKTSRNHYIWFAESDFITYSGFVQIFR